MAKTMKRKKPAIGLKPFELKPAIVVSDMNVRRKTIWARLHQKQAHQNCLRCFLSSQRPIVNKAEARKVKADSQANIMGQPLLLNRML